MFGNNDYRDYLMHKAADGHRGWQKHKYIDKIKTSYGWRYVYPETRTRRQSMNEAREISSSRRDYGGYSRQYPRSGIEGMKDRVVGANLQFLSKQPGRKPIDEARNYSTWHRTYMDRTAKRPTKIRKIKTLKPTKSIVPKEDLAYAKKHLYEEKMRFGKRNFQGSRLSKRTVYNAVTKAGKRVYSAANKYQKKASEPLYTPERFRRTSDLAREATKYGKEKVFSSARKLIKMRRPASITR